MDRFEGKGRGECGVDFHVFVTSGDESIGFVSGLVTDTGIVTDERVCLFFGGEELAIG